MLPVSIGGFTNAKLESGDQPQITGTSEPDAKITITIYPDGIGAEVYADKNGKWFYKPTKKLTAGPKNILVVATKAGAQGQITKEFIVRGGKSNPFGIILLFMIVLAVGFGGYVFYKSNQ